MSSSQFESFDQLLEEYGMTDDEVDEIFDQPWPGQRCPTCSGGLIPGMVNGEMTECNDCSGTGVVQERHFS